MVYVTAWRFDNGEYPVREISMAKLHAARVACEVADECIQIHGGAGYMREYGVERVWRDMRLNRIGAGTDEIMLDVIGRSLRVCDLGDRRPPFTDEHEELRESVRGFIERELAPHAQQWEDEHWFPDEVFGQLAAQGLLGLKYPSELRRAGRRLPARGGARRGAGADRLRRHGRRDRRAHQHRHPADLEVRHRGAEAALPGAGDPRREDRRARHHRARRRLGRGGDQHARRAGGRRLGGQRREDLHHQRRARALHRHRREDDRARAATTASRS